MKRASAVLAVLLVIGLTATVLAAFVTSNSPQSVLAKYRTASGGLSIPGSAWQDPALKPLLMDALSGKGPQVATQFAVSHTVANYSRYQTMEPKVVSYWEPNLNAYVISPTTQARGFDPTAAWNAVSSFVGRAADWFAGLFTLNARAVGCTGTGSCYWVGGNGNFSDGTHWATASGGAVTGGTPAATDAVFFDAGSGNGTATQDNATFTSGSVTISSTTLMVNGSSNTWDVGGDWNSNTVGAAFKCATSTVNFTATGNITVGSVSGSSGGFYCSANDANRTFYNISLAAAGATTTIVGGGLIIIWQNVLTTGTGTLTGGTVYNVNSAPQLNPFVNGGGTIASIMTFDRGTNMNMPATTTVGTTIGFTQGAVASAGWTVTLQGTITSGNAVTVASYGGSTVTLDTGADQAVNARAVVVGDHGVFEAHASVITLNIVSAVFEVVAGGTFNYDTSNVSFTQNGTIITLDVMDTPYFYDLTIAAGITVFLNSHATLTNSFTIGAGATISGTSRRLRLNTSSLTAGAGAILNVSFDWRPPALGAYVLPGVTYNSVLLVSSGSTFTLGGALTTTGSDVPDGSVYSIALDGVTLDTDAANNYSLTVGGAGLVVGYVAAGSFLSNASVVSISSNVSIQSTVYFDLGSSTWTVGGSWTNNSTSALWNAGTSAFTFTSGVNVNIYPLNAAGPEFHNVTFNTSAAAGTVVFTLQGPGHWTQDATSLLEVEGTSGGLSELLSNVNMNIWNYHNTALGMFAPTNNSIITVSGATYDTHLHNTSLGASTTVFAGTNTTLFLWQAIPGSNYCGGKPYDFYNMTINLGTTVTHDLSDQNNCIYNQLTVNGTFVGGTALQTVTGVVGALTDYPLVMGASGDISNLGMFEIANYVRAHQYLPTTVYPYLAIEGVNGTTVHLAGDISTKNCGIYNLCAVLVRGIHGFDNTFAFYTDNFNMNVYGAFWVGDGLSGPGIAYFGSSTINAYGAFFPTNGTAYMQTATLNAYPSSIYNPVALGADYAGVIYGNSATINVHGSFRLWPDATAMVSAYIAGSSIVNVYDDAGVFNPAHPEYGAPGDVRIDQANYYIDFGTSVWTIEGNWRNISTSASFNAASGIITFTGTGTGGNAHGINAGNAASYVGGVEFNVVTFDPNSALDSTYNIGSNRMVVGGLLTVQNSGSGTTMLSDAAFNVGFTLNANPTSVTIGANGVLAGGSSTYTITNNLLVSSASGYMRLGSGTWTVYGAWTNNSTSALWDDGTGAVNFNSSASQNVQFGAMGVSEFYNLWVRGNGIAITYTMQVNDLHLFYLHMSSLAGLGPEIYLATNGLSIYADNVFMAGWGRVQSQNSTIYVTTLWSIQNVNAGYYYTCAAVPSGCVGSDRVVFTGTTTVTTDQVGYPAGPRNDFWNLEIATGAVVTVGPLSGAYIGNQATINGTLILGNPNNPLLGFDIFSWGTDTPVVMGPLADTHLAGFFTYFNHGPFTTIYVAGGTYQMLNLVPYLGHEGDTYEQTGDIRAVCTASVPAHKSCEIIWHTATPGPGYSWFTYNTNGYELYAEGPMFIGDFVGESVIINFGSSHVTAYEFAPIEGSIVNAQTSTIDAYPSYAYSPAAFILERSAVFNGGSSLVRVHGNLILWTFAPNDGHINAQNATFYLLNDADSGVCTVLYHCPGDMWIQQPTYYIDLGASTWNLAGDWLNLSTSASWSAGSSTVIFDYAGGAALTPHFAYGALPVTEFYSLEFDGAVTYTLTAAAPMSHDLTVGPTAVLDSTNFNVPAYDTTVYGTLAVGTGNFLGAFTLTVAFGGALTMDGHSVTGFSLATNGGTILIDQWNTFTMIAGSPNIDWHFNPSVAGARITITLLGVAPNGTYTLFKDGVDIQDVFAPIASVSFDVTGGWSPHTMHIGPASPSGPGGPGSGSNSVAFDWQEVDDFTVQFVVVVGVQGATYTWTIGGSQVGAGKQFTYDFGRSGVFDVTVDAIVNGKSQSQQTKTVTVVALSFFAQNMLVLLMLGLGLWFIVMGFAVYESALGRTAGFLVGAAFVALGFILSAMPYTHIGLVTLNAIVLYLGAGLVGASGPVGSKSRGAALLLFVLGVVVMLVPLLPLLVFA